MPASAHALETPRAVIHVDARIAAATLVGALVLVAYLLWGSHMLRPWDPLRVFRPAAPLQRPPHSDLPDDACARALELTPSHTAPYYRGLVNPNVYCFFNSVVQCLGSLTRLAHYLDDTTRMAGRWNVPTPITDALRALLVALNTPHSARRALAPRELQAALARVSQSNGLRTLLGAHQQQDAHELCVLLVHALNAELGNVQHARSQALRAEAAGLNALVAPSHLVHGHPRTQLGGPGEHVAPPFRGTLAQRTACGQCGYMEAVRHFAFTDLDLVVPGVACTLEQCLAAWSQLEQVDWVCHRCSLRATDASLAAEVARLEAKPPSARTKHRLARVREQKLHVTAALRSGAHESEWEAARVDEPLSPVRALSPAATKQVLLAAPPPVLVLHLNRSSFSLGAYGASKNHARVVFRESLDVTPFTMGAALHTDAFRPLSTQGARGSVRYQLRGIVTHYGSHNYGHYVCFRRRPDRTWTRISDEQVQECTLDDVLLQNPYLLMYERLDTPRGSDERLRGARRARILHRWDSGTAYVATA